MSYESRAHAIDHRVKVHLEDGSCAARHRRVFNQLGDDAVIDDALGRVIARRCAGRGPQGGIGHGTHEK